jgi:hypothetical protein
LIKSGSNVSGFSLRKPSLEASEITKISQYSTLHVSHHAVSKPRPWPRQFQLGYRGGSLRLDLVDWGPFLWQNVFEVNQGHPRIARENKTVAVMIDLYCRNQHSSGGLCAECSELLAYANERLEECPFQEGKTTCAKCPVHCFKPAMRDGIKAVMRYSGPRMLRSHPILAMRHFMDRSRQKPIRPHRKSADSDSD